MTGSDDLSQLNDPEFLAERKRVREQLEHAPSRRQAPARRPGSRSSPTSSCGAPRRRGRRPAREEPQ
jgi:hypothetical protein